jgi:hypothetical protein
MEDIRKAYKVFNKPHSFKPIDIYDTRTPEKWLIDGETVEYSGETPERGAAYNFIGWSRTQNSLVADADFTITGETYFYAVYEEIPLEPEVMILDEKLPSGRYNASAVLVETNAYLFGGGKSSGRGTDGQCNEILKFDTTTETITTLSAKSPEDIRGSATALVGTNVYLFSDELYRKNTIYKFDTLTETTTTLSVTLSTGRAGASAVAVGNTAYIFGGWNDNTTLDEIIKITNL